MYFEVLNASVRRQEMLAEAARWHVVDQAMRDQARTAAARVSPIATMRQTAGGVLIGVGERLRGLPRTDEAPEVLPAMR